MEKLRERVNLTEFHLLTLNDKLLFEHYISCL